MSPPSGDTAVTSLGVVTPTYAPDYELCVDLNKSVLAHTPSTVIHYLIVPNSDLDLFAPLDGDRTRVLPVSSVLPRHLVSLPRSNSWLNLRRPFPPVRGWIMQQLVKLAAPDYVNADLLLFADSDVVFVRPVSPSTFTDRGRIRLYRRPAAVTQDLPRHIVWHRVARQLLGLPESPPPYADYVNAFTMWDRRSVVAMRQHIESVSGRPWVDTVGSKLHFSEFTLYGVFIDEVLASSTVYSDEHTLCHSYWDTGPLDARRAREFVAELPATDVAIMISAKSQTPLLVRRAALSQLNGGNDGPSRSDA